MNLRNLFAMFAMVVMVACGGGNTTAVNEAEVLNPAKANTAAQSFVGTLYANQNVKGPVCMPEAVVDGYTQCSFSYQETASVSDATTGESVDTKTTHVGTVLCNNNGCMEGDAPTMMAADMAPDGYAETDGHDSITDDWLFWYMLSNNGGTSYGYNSWYSNTPSYGRSAYYSRTYVPTAQSRTYYTSSYSAPVKSASTTRYSSKTASSKKSTGTTSKSTTGTTSKSTTGTTSKKTTGSGSTTTSSKSTGSRSTSTTKKTSSSKKSSGSRSSSRKSSGSRRR